MKIYKKNYIYERDTTAQKMKFSIKYLVTITEETLNAKLHFFAMYIIKKCSRELHYKYNPWKCLKVFWSFQRVKSGNIGQKLIMWHKTFYYSNNNMHQFK